MLCCSFYKEMLEPHGTLTETNDLGFKVKGLTFIIITCNFKLFISRSDDLKETKMSLTG